MANILAKAALSAKIKAMFLLHTAAELLHVTPDGQCFFENDKSFADLHARQNKMAVQSVKRSDYVSAADEAAYKAEQDAKAKAKADAAAQVKAEADAKATAEADTKAKAEAGAKASAQAAAEKITADLKAQAVALGIPLEGEETDADLTALIADATKEGADKTAMYATMTVPALKAECDKRTPAITYGASVKKQELIDLLTAADVAAATPATA